MKVLKNRILIFSFWYWYFDADILMLIFWCCQLQVDEEVAAWAADEATPTLEKIFSKFATCWINLFPSKPDKNLTCTVEELGQFKSFRQNSSNSSLSSSLEKILSISWNDVDSFHRNINSILFNCKQYSQTSGRQFYGNLLINDLMKLSWGMKTEEVKSSMKI